MTNNTQSHQQPGVNNENQPPSITTPILFLTPSTCMSLLLRPSTLMSHTVIRSKCISILRRSHSYRFSSSFANINTLSHSTNHHLQLKQSIFPSNYPRTNVYCSVNQTFSAQSSTTSSDITQLTCTSNSKSTTANPIPLTTDDKEKSAQKEWVITGPEDQQLFIVDAFGLLYRSYYALASTTMSSHGLFDTRAVYGFTTVLLSFLQKQAKGNPVVVVFEGRKKKGESDFRTQLYPAYKEGRGPTPTGIIQAIPWVKKICNILGVALVEVDLFEADDTIGTIVNKTRRVGLRSCIVSMDKDFRQLLETDFVEICKPGQGGSFENITEESFRKDFQNIHPRQYIDVLALIGDNVDGLKGVPGIGKLTAPRLIAHYGSLESLLDAARIYISKNNEQEASDKSALNDAAPKKRRRKKSKEDLPPLLTARLAKNLLDNEQHALLVKRLITIRENVPLGDVEWEDLMRKEVDVEQTKELFRKLEFSNLSVFKRFLRSADDVPHLQGKRGNISRKGDAKCNDTNQIDGLSPLLKQSSEDISQSNLQSTLTGSEESTENLDYKRDVSDEELKSFMQNVGNSIGIVPVTNGKGSKTRLDGLCLCSAPGQVVYISTSDLNELPDSVIKLLKNQRIQKVGWFLKDLHKLLIESFGVRLEGELFDNRIASEILHGGEKITDGKIAALYLGERSLDTWTKGQNHHISLGFPIEESMQLCDVGRKLGQKLKSALEEGDLYTVASTVEFPLIQVLGDMELAGVPLDANGLQTLEQSLRGDLNDVEKEIEELAPQSEDFVKGFRPSSRDDVAKLLFEIWEIKKKGKKKTASGRYSVNHGVLTRILDEPDLSEHKRRFVELILRHRELSKIISTYTKSLIASIHPDGRVRTTFLQDAAASGRLSTSNPNLQSIPIRSEIGRQVRKMVQAKLNFSIVCADYSQIELRIIAAMSGDKSLQKAFASDVDVHTSVAGKLFKLKSNDEVTVEQRRKAKEVNYGIPYGVSAYGLSQHLNLSVSEAKTLITEYYREFPRVELLTKKLVRDATEKGYAETMLGRRLPLPLLIHGGPQERKAAGRVAINMPVQGTQADMIKLAMIRISRRLLNSGAKSKMIMQLHDELVLEVADNEMMSVIEVVEEEMTTAFPLPGVDVKIKIGSGKSWLAAVHN